MYTSHLLFFLGGEQKKKKKKTATLWDEQARTNKPGQAKDSVGKVSQMLSDKITSFSFFKGR